VPPPPWPTRRSTRSCPSWSWLPRGGGNLSRLPATVDSLSADLSPVEQERAAFFLVSTHSLVVQSIIERGDPAHPMLTEWMDPPRKFAGDNPYTIYTQVPVNGAYTYRLSGRKGSYVYLGVQLYGEKSGFNLPTGNTSLPQIEFNADGTFDLYISPEKIDHPNWIDTGGLYEGSYSSRYMLSTETEFPALEIVPIAGIKPL
jgi:hypothetical protein